MRAKTRATAIVFNKNNELQTYAAPVYLYQHFLSQVHSLFPLFHKPMVWQRRSYHWRLGADDLT